MGVVLVIVLGVVALGGCRQASTVSGVTKAGRNYRFKATIDVVATPYGRGVEAGTVIEAVPPQLFQYHYALVATRHLRNGAVKYWTDPVYVPSGRGNYERYDIVVGAQSGSSTSWGQVFLWDGSEHDEYGTYLSPRVGF